MAATDVVKRLVVCCDGTWERPDLEDDGQPAPTNVVRFALRVASLDRAGVPQIVYYHAGVGTGNLVDHLTGGAFGTGLVGTVLDAYRFLIANYVPGDELWFIGFSRGAYTVRSLGGLIRKCGILRRDVAEHYREAVALYRGPQHPDDAESRGFRAKYASWPELTPIKFLGVFDTVGSLGIPISGLRRLTAQKYEFHDTELSSAVEVARHALAIDERRAPFTPTLWSCKPKPGQSVKQQWFAGYHGDIGGGYLDRGSADPPLGWMLDEAVATGLALDARVVAAHPVTRYAFEGALHRSDTGISRVAGIQERVDFYDRADTTQSIDATALARWHSDLGYRPPILRRHLGV